MKEVEIWEHVLKWGLAQNPTLISDPVTWSDDDFKVMENTIQHCLSSIRFFSVSSKEFSQKVRPYKKLLKRQLYEDLLNSYLDPDSEPNDNVSHPRNNGIIDSQIINLNIVSTISRWIDKVDSNNNFSQFRELYLPYKFKLLLRGSRDGFAPKKLTDLVDSYDKHSSIIAFIKVKGAEEIIGDFGEFCKIKYNISKSIFSFKSKDNVIKDAIISNVNNSNYAIYYYNTYFGNGDVSMYASNESTDNNYRYVKTKIRDIEAEFSIEDYEVFQIIKK